MALLNGGVFLLVAHLHSGAARFGAIPGRATFHDAELMQVTTQTISPDCTRTSLLQFRDWLLEDFYRIEVVPADWWRAVDEAVARLRYQQLYEFP